MNVFVITSSIVVTLTMPSLPPQTETRRLRHAASNDLLTLEKLNALSRRICTAPPSIEEFQRQLNDILAQHPDPKLHLTGSVLAASSFAIFFGGNLWDGLLAGGIAVLICWMERYLSPFCMNGVEFQFIASFLSGVSTLLLCRFGMQFMPISSDWHHHAADSRHHADKFHPGHPTWGHYFRLSSAGGAILMAPPFALGIMAASVDGRDFRMIQVFRSCSVLPLVRSVLD